MGSSLTLKKSLLIAAIPILLYLLLWLVLGSSYIADILGLGSESIYEEYPNSIWLCNEPSIKMAVPASPYSLDESYVIVDDTAERVSIFISKKEDTVLICSVNADGSAEDTLLQGNHIKISSSKISFHVLRDNLFNYKYSTIILERQSSGPSPTLD